VLLDAGKGEFGQARVGQIVNLAVGTKAPVHNGRQLARRRRGSLGSDASGFAQNERCFRTRIYI
jgi:hypothetical protein